MDLVRKATRVRQLEAYVTPAAVIVAAMLTYWLVYVDRLPPYNLTEGEIIPAKAQELQTVKARWRVTINRTGRYDSSCTRAVVDSTGSFTRIAADAQDRENVTVPTGSHITLEFIVPRRAAWGPAEYQQYCCYHMNGFSLSRFRMFPICVQRPPLRFEILPPKG